ncbi:hypothetical protein RND71_019410 [Anisodus tanguticus]|uniref:Uncharacterized protein n=1 Tax=Anisodus tanguticus TaxID=243964 RepID=A0AAE1V8G2_9SOLA|nr:hypothetical protein RND71_019410 [Anisodus tanguticus]
MTRVRRRVEGKGKSKGKSTETSVSSLIQSLATIDLNPSYNRATVDLLTEGLNKGTAVIAAVRCLVKYEYKAPVSDVLEAYLLRNDLGLKHHLHDCLTVALVVELALQVFCLGSTQSEPFRLQGLSPNLQLSV